jgi:hypothetical protein
MKTKLGSRMLKLISKEMQECNERAVELFQKAEKAKSLTDARAMLRDVAGLHKKHQELQQELSDVMFAENITEIYTKSDEN